MRTLQLNVGYEPIGLISWKKAVKKVVRGKAEVLDVQDSPLRSCYIEEKKPAVIRILKYHRNYGQVKLCRENIYARDQYICQYCGEKFIAKELTLDHVIPESRGGPFSWKNLVTCCASCNNRKDARTPKEAEMPLLRKPFKPNWMPSVLAKSIKRGRVPKQWISWISWIEEIPK
jgi:5-methylcytosine-specific restriction endonuclease McrA